jgi:cytochrome c556
MKPRTIVVGVIACASVVWADHHLPAPAHLPNAVRQIVQQRMARHSKEMTELVWAVVFLDYAGVTRQAQKIADEPRLARPVTGDATELNAIIPERFFALQEQLRVRAGRLADAARSHDDGMAAEYGKLAETCVACHQAYLNEPPSR